MKMLKLQNKASKKDIKNDKKPNFNITTKFLFEHAFVNDMKQVIKDFKSSKSVGGDIPINILK